MGNCECDCSKNGCEAISVTENMVEEYIQNVQDMKVGEKTTIVCLTLVNGFEVIGHSSCVDPENYDHEIGVEIALKMAVNKTWELLGFALQNEIAEKESE